MNNDIIMSKSDIIMYRNDLKNNKKDIIMSKNDWHYHVLLYRVSSDIHLEDVR
jgi:hypothetical protein